MKTSFTGRGAAARGDHQRAAEPSRRTVALSWWLAVATIPGAAAVVLFAYLKALGAAGCSVQTCPKLGPGELGFTLIVYGAPVVAVAAVVLSFVTARRTGGIAVPLIAWLLLIVAAVVLVVSFP